MNRVQSVNPAFGAKWSPSFGNRSRRGNTSRPAMMFGKTKAVNFSGQARQVKLGSAWHV